MSALSHALEPFIVPLWFGLITWLVVAVFISFFVVGRHVPGRGATPLFGAHVAWLSPAHAAELRRYRDLCANSNRSLIWWRLVRVFTIAWPVAFFALLALTLIVTAG
jgi:hypothetical protein